MDSRDKALEKVDQILSETGYTMSDLICFHAERSKDLLKLPEEDQTKFTKIYDSISNDVLTSAEKGKRLESLFCILFKNSLFDSYGNCHTSTNEIDLLVSWSQSASLSGISNAYPFFGDSFLCECKKYEGKVGVTYVGKFFSLMAVTDTTLGILVAWEGVTGGINGWVYSQGLIKKIALREKRYIIVITKEDLREIYDQKIDIFSMIHEKYIALKNEIDYSKYIKKHEAESHLQQKEG